MCHFCAFSLWGPVCPLNSLLTALPPSLIMRKKRGHERSCPSIRRSRIFFSKTTKTAFFEDWVSTSHFNNNNHWPWSCGCTLRDMIFHLPPESLINSSLGWPRHKKEINRSTFKSWKKNALFKKEYSKRTLKVHIPQYLTFLFAVHCFYTACLYAISFAILNND